MARQKKDEAEEGSRTVAIGGNSGAELKHYFERIERLAEEKKAIGQDMKDVLLEAKLKGFDVKIMRILLKRRAMAKAERDEQDTLVAVYEGAVGDDSDD